MDYKEQIKSPKWQKRRLEILQRDDFTCQICGNKDKTLHVHHMTYMPDNNIWEYPDEMLITLCEDCHEKEHIVERQLIDMIGSIKRRGVTNHEIYNLLQFIDMALFRKDDDCIRHIIGDYGDEENEIPYIKLLAKRRNKVKQ